MNITLTILFWVCSLAVITPHLLYPITLFVIAKLRKPKSPGGAKPTVSLVISAFNEEAIIEKKLENACGSHYPKDLLNIIVISDESTDRTDEIVKAFKNRGVNLFRQTPREGKSAALTKFVPRCSGEIIVFSDANSMYQPDAIDKLVRHFDDETVGYTVGHQRYITGDSAASQSENAYWNFEVMLKEWESRLSSVVGGDGAIMAIRRELFVPLEKDDINDFLIPLRIVSDGHVGVFEKEAICYEEAAPNFSGEFKRKVRIVNRSFRALTRAPAALNPFRVGIFAWQLFSHKVLRWLSPVFMIGCIATSAALAWQGSTFFLLAFAMQILLYTVAAARCIPKLGETKPVYLCYFFCLSNVAAAMGMWKWLIGKKFVTWTPQREQT